ncbi:MAG TPA: DNA polymerase III subunit alpha [Pirellulales bacterium]|jgi:DNA polymerase-3 subunit alpha|nr:DNA polymerase III subunit alpha [Pirellulales bacterium]
MSTPPFVHLHCHSHYSLLDGASPIDRLVSRAKELGMTGLALTDHGNLHGALEFYSAAKKAGINPILGYEAYIAADSRFKRDAGSLKEASYHLTLLAKNRVGFGNLIKLASAAFLEGFYHKPRIDKELLAAHNEGLICLSGCVSGELSRTLLKSSGPDKSHFDEAKKVVAWFQSVFGDRYFIEIQNNGVEIQRLALEASVEIARQMGLPLVATSDAHYVNREDSEAQDVLLCINTGKYRTDTNRMRMEGNQFYVRSPEEMYASFPGLEEAVKQSQTIADSVEIELELGKRHFPLFDPPDQKSPGEYLRELCLKGLKERYAGKANRWADAEQGATDEGRAARAEPVAHGGELSREVFQRLDRELGVIEKLGFPNYFLIVWDFVRYARERDIPATARGSGVGSLVAYALYLSHVCPLEYDLLFERFLDISRLEAPDIDIDFCKDRRGEVIQYVKEKYGEANVAQIGTFGTLKARAAIRDVGRALGMPIPRVDAVVAMVPEELGIELAEALQKSADLKRTYDADGEIRELLDLAMKIEGLARNVGTHAAAVVIADRPLTEYVPLQRVQNKDEIITQWAMGDVERAGLLKMDFLGLRNLTILSKAIDLIEQTTGKRIDPYQFPLDDKKTFALLCRGETKGVFQLESGGIRDLLQKMKPDSFRDIIATNALYRPGPLEGGMVDDYVQVKHGRKQPEYKHPVMKEILEETHGVMVYQEQVMRILNRLGDIPLPSAYTCIKAISKKKLETIAKFRSEFAAGAERKGMSAREATELFGLIEHFAGYGFNKSHSTAYALIAYITAYLKAHYPVEFMAALLSGDMPDRNFKKKDSLVEHREDCIRMGIDVLPPDVNRSLGEFAVVNDGGKQKIVFGLGAIKGCGGNAAHAIVAARRSGGPIRSLFEFYARIDPATCNRTAIESLIKAGAFDSLGARRAALMASVDRALQTGAAALADRRSGQKGLFADIDEDNDADAGSASLPDVPEWDERQKLGNEKEVLGFYLTSHPLAEHAARFKSYTTHATTAVPSVPHRTEVVLGGMLASLKFSHTKNPRPGSTNTKYVMFDLEDMDGMLRCIVWPEQFAEFGHLVVPDAVLLVRGVVDRRPGSEESNLIVNELIPLDELAARYTQGIEVRLREDAQAMERLERLYEILRGYPGKCRIELVLALADGTQAILKSEKLRIAVEPELRSRLDDLLGPGQVRLITARPTAGRAPPPHARDRNGSPRSKAMQS